MKYEFHRTHCKNVRFKNSSHVHDEHHKIFKWSRCAAPNLQEKKCTTGPDWMMQREKGDRQSEKKKWNAVNGERYNTESNEHIHPAYNPTIKLLTTIYWIFVFQNVALLLYINWRAMGRNQMNKKKQANKQTKTNLNTQKNPTNQQNIKWMQMCISVRKKLNWQQ